MKDYYVYVYIDPRNFEEFYYGKGKGSRKEAHLRSDKDSAKTNRIKDIKRAGLEPIIRVIASDLSEDEAFLIETTLIWKLGKYTTNIASGYFSGNFRPHDTLHLKLPGFDYNNSLFYYNVGEGPHRNWEDYTKYGFISAGQGPRWRDAIFRLNKGDVVVAYLKRHGYVGIGKVTHPAKMVRDVRIKNKPLLENNLKCKNMAENSDKPDKSEYVALVKWKKKVSRDRAFWAKNKKLFTSQLVCASLSHQPDTVKFLEKFFKLKLSTLIR